MEKEEKKKLLEEKNIHLWFVGSPVSLQSMKLELDMNVGAIFAYAKFMNVQPHNISSMVCDIICYDSIRNPVDVLHDCKYEGFDIVRNKEFGTEVPFKVKNQQTRNIEFVLKSVTTTSGQTWYNKDEKRFSKSLVQDSIFNVQTDMHSQFIVNCGKVGVDDTKMSFQPKFSKDYWLCACGTLNWIDETSCCSCGVDREWLRENTDMEILKSQKEQTEYDLQELRAKAAEQERLDRERAKQEFAQRKEAYKKQVKKSEGKKKFGKILPLILLLVILLAGGYFGVFYGIPYFSYKMAMDEYEKGSYDSARQKFEKMGDYLDSEEMVFKCTYTKADSYAQAGNYKAAAEMYQSIITYSDSEARYIECIKNYAAKIYEEAKYKEAIAALKQIDEQENEIYKKSQEKLYLQAGRDEKKQYFKTAYDKYDYLGDYKDSKQKAQECLYTVARLAYEKLDYKEALEKYDQLKGYKDVDNILDKISTLRKLISAAGKDDGSPAAWETEDGICPKCQKQAQYIFEFRLDGTYKISVKCETDDTFVVAEGRFKIEDSVLYDAEYKKGKMLFKKMADIKEVKDNVLDKEGKNTCIVITDPVNPKNKKTIKLYGNVITDDTVSLG